MKQGSWWGLCAWLLPVSSPARPLVICEVRPPPAEARRAGPGRAPGKGSQGSFLTKAQGEWTRSQPLQGDWPQRTQKKSGVDK